MRVQNATGHGFLRAGAWPLTIFHADAARSAIRCLRDGQYAMADIGVYAFAPFSREARRSKAIGAGGQEVTHAAEPPVIGMRRPVDRRRPTQRWNEIVERLLALPAKYAACWKPSRITDKTASRGFRRD